MTFKISLIIPVYNVENYLSNTIESIISQSFGFENIEVILIDDKSTDNSANIIKEYANKYENIKGIFLDKGSGFPGKPRNIGLNVASSEYIMFLDSDDYLESDACEKLYNVIVEENADIVSGSFTIQDEMGNEKLNFSAWVSTLTDPIMDYNMRVEKTKNYLADSNFKFIVTDLNENGFILGNSNVWGKIFKANLIKDNKIKFPEDIVAQDSVFLLESFFNADKIVFIKDILVHYNNQRSDDGDKSVSHIKSNNNLYGRIKAYELMNNLSKRHSKEKLFYNYVLGPKLVYWFKHHLLESQISTFEISNIFKKYSHLFSKCYEMKVPMASSTKEIFKEISFNRFDVAAKLVSILQQNSFSKNDAPIKVSVIVSICHNGTFLKRCLDSIINQSLKDIEILCIFDELNYFDVLDEYKSKTENIKLILHEDMNSSKNRGIDEANGDYIIFLDSNDWLEEDALEKLFDMATLNKSNLVLFNATNYNNDIKQSICYFDKDLDENFTFNYNFSKNSVLFNDFVGSDFYETIFLRENLLNCVNESAPIFYHIGAMLLSKKISYCADNLFNHMDVTQFSLDDFEIFDKLEKFLKDLGYYNMFQLNFLDFKICDLESRLSKSDSFNKNELFNSIKIEFLSMNLSFSQLKKLSSKSYKFYINVLNYDSFFEYYYFNDIKLDNDKLDVNYNNLFKYQNNLIVDLNNELSLFKENNILYYKFVEDILRDDFMISAIRKILEWNLFDEDFYRTKYNYMGSLHPLIHYIYEGYKNGWNPCEKFDTCYYESVNKNINEYDLNPLVYFVMYGYYEGIIRINDKIVQHKSINKLQLDLKLREFNHFGITNIKREQKVIVSLTSFPDRLSDIHYCIYSLLNQSFVPDEVILWLAEEQFPNKFYDLPKELLKLQDNGLTIKWCEDLKSYKKLIPALKEFPDCYIVTADDDIFYPSDWLEKIWEDHEKYPDCLISSRSRRISLSDNQIDKYKKWKLHKKESLPSYLNFSTNGAGTLFYPNSLSEIVVDENLFLELSPFGDDIWFWAMAVLNHTKIKQIDEPMNILTYINPSREIGLFDEFTLFGSNRKGRNDDQIKKVLNHFPEIIRIIENENEGGV